MIKVMAKSWEDISRGNFYVAKEKDGFIVLDISHRSVKLNDSDKTGENFYDPNEVLRYLNRQHDHAMSELNAAKHEMRKTEKDLIVMIGSDAEEYAEQRRVVSDCERNVYRIENAKERLVKLIKEIITM